MPKNKKVKISPQIYKDAKGQPKKVYLKYEAYEYILSEIDNLKKKLELLKK